MGAVRGDDGLWGELGYESVRECLDTLGDVGWALVEPEKPALVDRAWHERTRGDPTVHVDLQQPLDVLDRAFDLAVRSFPHKRKAPAANPQVLRGLDRDRNVTHADGVEPRHQADRIGEIERGQYVI